MIRCSVEGCARRHNAHGFCGAHYWRWKRHGDPLGGGKARAPNGAPRKWLHDHLGYDGDDCLIWPFGKTEGYAALSTNGKTNTVNRYLCELVNGTPPTPQHVVRHLCGNGHLGCVHPKHICWGTNRQNVDDRTIHGTNLRGDRNGQCKLTEPEVREILALKGVESQNNLAKRFNVSQTLISLIHRRKAWAWLT